jgi:hypothetical protein
VSFSVLFVCVCVLYHCNWVATQLQLNILYYISIIYHIVSYHISYCISYRISKHISYHTMPYHISYHATPYRIISYHIISYHTMPCHIIYHIVSNHIISYQISIIRKRTIMDLILGRGKRFFCVFYQNGPDRLSDPNIVLFKS